MSHNSPCGRQTAIGTTSETRSVASGSSSLYVESEVFLEGNSYVRLGLKSQGYEDQVV